MEAWKAGGWRKASKGFAVPLTKYTVSEVRQRIETPLADARVSDRSHDREGVLFSKYATVFMK